MSRFFILCRGFLLFVAVSVAAEPLNKLHCSCHGDAQLNEQHKRYLLSDATACRELGISQRTLQRYLLSKRIQPPVGMLAKNRRGWSRAEIDMLREQLADGLAADEALTA